MNTQRGFVQLSVMAWGAIAAGVVMLGMVVALKVQTHRLETCKAEFAMFKAQVEALGLAAEKAAKEKEAKDKLAKEKADAENARTTATLTAAVKRLRDARSSSSFVPSAPAASTRPDLACFDRAEYQRTDGIFTTGARNLSDEGTESTVNLNSAKTWAQEQ